MQGHPAGADPRGAISCVAFAYVVINNFFKCIKVVRIIKDMLGGTNRYSWNAAVKSRQLDSRMLPPKQQPLFDEEAPRVARGAGNTSILKFGVRGGLRDSAVRNSQSIELARALPYPIRLDT